MESSPSFNSHSCINNIIANRVVQELQVDKGFNVDLISFSDDQENTQEDEFEFPLLFPDASFQTDNIIDNHQILPRYPLFDTRVLNLDSNLDSKSAPVSAAVVPPTRLPLGKLLSEDRDSTQSTTLVLESNDLDKVSPETYCVWKPQEQEHQPPKQRHSRGKHKKSNSISISELVGSSSKRWKVRDLLKRSYSDDSKHTSGVSIYSPPSKQKTGKDGSVVVLFPPISPKPNNDKVKKPEKALKTTASMGGGCANHKPEDKITPAYKAKIGNIRLPAFLPYRQDQHQVDAFANHYKWVNCK